MHHQEAIDIIRTALEENRLDEHELVRRQAELVGRVPRERLQANPNAELNLIDIEIAQELQRA